MAMSCGCNSAVCGVRGMSEADVLLSSSLNPETGELVTPCGTVVNSNYASLLLDYVRQDDMNKVVAHLTAIGYIDPENPSPWKRYGDLHSDNLFLATGKLPVVSAHGFWKYVYGPGINPAMVGLCLRHIGDLDEQGHTLPTRICDAAAHGHMQPREAISLITCIRGGLPPGADLGLTGAEFEERRERLARKIASLDMVGVAVVERLLRDHSM